MTPPALASIPSPSSNALRLGGLEIHYYGLMIALGVIAAVLIARKRWGDRGGDPEQIVDMAFWAVPGGLIGARLYSVITDFNRLYAHHLGDIVKVWKGGLGIPGGVIGGVAVGVWYARRRRMPLGPLFDVVAPALPAAQVIGRFGNYFNQELFGRPTDLPWALHIDLAHRQSLPPKYLPFSTFQPTFAYEALWNLVLVVLLITVDRFRGRLPALVLGCLYGFFALGFGADLWLVVQRQHPQSAGVQVVLLVVGALVGLALVWAVTRFDRRGPLHWGDLFALYLAGYFVGRLWVESLRIDTANTIVGLRVNEWTSLIVIAASLGFIAAGRRRRPEPVATASNVKLPGMPVRNREGEEQEPVADRRSDEPEVTQVADVEAPTADS